MIYFICPTSNVFGLPQNQRFWAIDLKDLLCVLVLLIASPQHPTQMGLSNKRNVLASTTKREREKWYVSAHVVWTSDMFAYGSRSFDL